MGTAMPVAPPVLVRVARLEGNTPRHEDRWVNPGEVLAVAPGGGGYFSIHLSGLGCWQCVCGDRAIPGPLRAGLVPVRVALIRESGPRHETRWVNPSKVIAVEPASEGSFLLRVSGLGRWQCVGDPGEFVQRLAGGAGG